MEAKKDLKARETNIIKYMMFSYFPYWPLFAFLVMVFGAAAWLYMAAGKTATAVRICETTPVKSDICDARV